MKERKVNIITDGQYGSTGKGLLAQWVAMQFKGDQQYLVCSSSGSPNAGHTFFHNGKKKVCHHLPVSGVVLGGGPIFLSAASIIDLQLLEKEVNECLDGDWSRIYIHPRAALISVGDKQQEAEDMAFIASTQKGVGAALASKIRRKGTVFGSLSNHKAMASAMPGINEANYTVIHEMGQGFDLSINSGLDYPHCTSREITVAQGLSDLGVHPSRLGSVYMAMRCHPIRVGHIFDGGRAVGNSGPFHKDQKEIDWDHIGVDPEFTTVTGRKRRVFTFSKEQYRRAIVQNRPDVVFLNFVNYLKTIDDFNTIMVKMNQAEAMAGIETIRTIYGLGPSVEDIVDDGSDLAFREGVGFVRGSDEVQTSEERTQGDAV